jgi:hypothetical protein
VADPIFISGTEREDMTVGELVHARPLDTSARWAEALRGDGPMRAEALRWVRAHLAAAAKFELDRRGITLDGAQRSEAASLVRDATEAALAAILADLDLYGAQSAFTTWTAKYAIHEVAAAAREKETTPSSSRNGKGEAGGASTSRLPERLLSAVLPSVRRTHRRRK